MYNKQIRKASATTWKHYSYKGYSAFASLGKLIRIGVLSVATLATVTPVRAEQESKASREATGDGEELDEVTVSGTMAPLTQLQSARIVAVLGRTDIEQAAVQSVNDLLKLATGVDVRQRGGFGIQTDISIDGGTYEQVTILLNGVNISNPHTGHLAADFPVAIQDIERIEVLEGAASRVYGGQAFGGAINVVTRHDRENAVSLGAEAGSHATFAADGRATYTTGKVSNRLSGGGGRSDGGTINDAWSRGQLYWQGDLTDERLNLAWQFGFSRKEYGANTFYGGASNDQWEQNERYLISVEAETKGHFRLSPCLYWNRTYDNYQWNKGIPNNSHQADVFGARLGGHIRWRAGETALGAELRQEGILSSSLGTPMEEADYVWAHGAQKQYTRRADRTNVSYSVEHNILLPRWTLSAGIMASMNTATGHRHRFYPGVDIACRPATGWKLYLSYNKGFRLPSYTDLYYSSPDITGNDQLRPEENRSLALGAQLRRGGLSATLRGFYNRGRNMIDYVKREYGDAAHADNFNLDNLGAQAELAYDFTRLGERVYLNNIRVGYTYIHQRRKGGYDIFTSLYADDYLRHKLTASLCHRVWSRLSATWSVRYQRRMGAYQVYDGLTATDCLQAYRPYATLDLRLQWTDRRFQVYAQGTNLTNRRYQDLGNIPQPGIWLMAGARWNIRL